MFQIQSADPGAEGRLAAMFGWRSWPGAAAPATASPPAPEALACLGWTAPWAASSLNDLFTVFPIQQQDSIAIIGDGDGRIGDFCAGIGTADLAIADPDLTHAAAICPANGRVIALPDLTMADRPAEVDGCFSAIISQNLIDRVARPEALLSWLARIGRPGARYLLIIPSPSLADLRKDLMGQHAGGVHLLARGEFARLVTAAGLTVEQHHVVPLFPAEPWRAASEMTHPLMEAWARHWGFGAALQRGRDMARAMYEAIPRMQVILARKAG
jgi:hypothetical protein